MNVILLFDVNLMGCASDCYSVLWGEFDEFWLSKMIGISWHWMFEIPWIADPLARGPSCHSNIFMVSELRFLVLLSLMVSPANFRSTILCFCYSWWVHINISLLSVFAQGGSGYCKFGWSKYACPSGQSATFLVMILVGTSTKQWHVLLLE